MVDRSEKTLKVEKVTENSVKVKVPDGEITVMVDTDGGVFLIASHTLYLQPVANNSVQLWIERKA